MKLKYYLRGIGVGILFSTIILSVSFHSTKNKQLSDAEIIQKAEELGMVNKDDVEMGDLVAPSVTPAPDSTSNSTTELAQSQEEVTTEEQTAASTPEPTKKPTVTPSKKPVKNQDKEQTSDKTDTNDNTTKVTPDANKDESKKTFVKFEIAAGMTSEDVANLLKHKGVIEDSKAFNQYLIQNNYTTDINVGKYEVEKFASYEDIAETIVK